MAPSPVSAAIHRLQEWEAQLEPWFTSVRLLGEIPLSATEVEEIGHALRDAGSTRVRKSMWPHTLAVYMAAVAARNDERRYWGVLTDNLGITNNPQTHSRLSTIFEECLDHYQLPRFQAVGGYVHVTPIRLHGGIPAYSLSDFFEEVILPATTEDEYVGTEANELIPQILERSAVLHFVDSPVRYFLEYGGEPARTFFNNCIAMVRDWQSHGGLRSTREYGLPLYVIEAFAAFMEGRARTPQGRHLRSPKLLLASSSGDALFSLELPEQPVDAEQAGWRYSWRVLPLSSPDNMPWEDEVIEESVRVRRSGYDFITVGRSLPLFLPPCQLLIHFEASSPDGDVAVLGRWRLNLGPDTDHAVLAFRLSDGYPIGGGRGLPAETLLLLFPRVAQLRTSGPGRCVQVFPELIGVWAAWQVEEWDLHRSRTIWLEDEDGQRLGSPVSIQQARAEARLFDGHLVTGLASATFAPLYAGTPPKLWIPRITGENPASEMDNWHVKLSSRWATRSRVDDAIEHPLSHWQTVVGIDREGFTLPLIELLGEEPLGTFGLDIRGPRSFRQEIRMRIWSEFIIEGLEPYYLPGRQGPEPAHIEILLPEGQRVETPAGETETTVICTEQDYYQIMVSPSATDARLELVAPRPNDDPVRLSLRLAIPRLRWLLRMDETTPEWLTTSTEMPAAHYLQCQTRNLILDWAETETMPDGHLVLQDSTNDPVEILQEVALKVLAGNSRRQKVDLGAFHDTIQYHGDVPILSLALRVGGPDDCADVPLLHLKRSLDLQAVLLEWEKPDTTRLYWDAPHRLRNRRVRIWSAWRPWEPAREIIVPNDAAICPLADGAGSGMIDLPEALPRGWYWITMRIAHGWEPLNAPAQPTADALLSQDIDWELRVLELDEAITAGGESEFSTRFELVCIFDAAGKTTERDAMARWLYNHPCRGVPNQVVALRSWLQSRDPDSARVLCMRMYQPELLQRLFDEEQDDEVRSSYLNGFTSTRSIRPEAAKLVLSHSSEPEWIVHSLTILLQRDLVSAIDYILTQMDNGAFSDRDALTLLAEKAEDVFECLQARPRTPSRDRLIIALADHVNGADLIRRGTWVHSEAGWGRIQRIHDNGIEQSFCFPNEPSLRLRVTLRHGHAPESVEIDTSSKTIQFLETGQVYQCTKPNCTGFRSVDQHRVIWDHNHAAHLGIGPAYVPIPTRASYRQPLRFAPQPPEDPFL